MPFSSLPRELLAEILKHLPSPEDVARASATAHLLHSRSHAELAVVETALRLRASANELASLQSPDEIWMSGDAYDAVATLFWLERRNKLALSQSRGGVLSAGDDLTLLVRDSKVYSCGSDECGQLGHELGSRIDEMMPGVMYGSDFAQMSKLRPIRAFSSRPVKTVAAGQNVSVVLLTDGSVYTFGEAFSCGHPEPDADAYAITSPRKIAALDGVLITNVSAHRHCLAVSASGSVYGWGEANMGELGFVRDQGRIQWEPKRIDALRGTRVHGTSVKGGLSVILAAGGVVYACGNNDHGQIRLPPCSHVTQPTRLHVPSAQAVAAGGPHILVLTRTGHVYACGRNTFGQLGLAHRSDVHEPTRVRVGSSSTKIVAIAADTRHSAAISAEGRVYTWGAYGHGRLGHGPLGQDVLKPRVITAARLSGATQIQCNCRTMVLCEDGSIHGFGPCNAGALGVPHISGPDGMGGCVRTPRQVHLYDDEPAYDETDDEHEAQGEGEEEDVDVGYV